MKKYLALSLTFCLCISSLSCGQPPQRGQSRASGSSKLTPQIQWFGVLDEGLAEAERTGKPILLISAACQCAGVPGMW